MKLDPHLSGSFLAEHHRLTERGLVFHKPTPGRSSARIPTTAPGPFGSIDQPRDERGRWAPSDSTHEKRDERRRRREDRARARTERTQRLAQAQRREAMLDARLKECLAARCGDAYRPTVDQFDRLPGREGQYTPERDAMHQEVVDKMLKDAEERGVPRGNEAVFLGGLPGAGKSSAVADMLDPSRYVVISPDDMKAALAERDAIPTPTGLRPMEASPLVGQEAMDMSWRLADQATAQGYNVVWDVTSDDASWYRDRVSAMQSPLPLDQRAALASIGASVPEPYRVTGIMVDVPISQSHESVTARYAAGGPYGGRAVPHDYINASAHPEYGTVQRAAFEQSKPLFDQWALIDNTGHQGRLVDQSKGFKL